MPSYYEFKLPAKILSGDGALEHIPHELEALGCTRPGTRPAIPAGPDRSGPHGKAAARRKARRRSFSVSFSGFRPPVPRCAKP